MKTSVPATPRADLNGGRALPGATGEDRAREGAPTILASPQAGSTALCIAVTGATGLIGAALVDRLRAARHEIRVVRHQEPLIPARFAGCDAVIHLAGESIANERWTAAKKQRIRESRVRGTRELAELLARLDRPPAAFIVASAIGYYGDRADELLTERSASGNGFLAEVCRAWEAAAEPARRAGARVVNLRFGMVLSRHGGALAKMLTPFRLGLGGRVGHGRQWMSWITLTDAARAIEHALREPSLSGPVNVVAPHPVINRDFTQTLGRVLRRPAFLPLPAVAAQGIFGELGRELLLASARVEPQRLLDAGFALHHPTLEAALRALLKPSAERTSP